MNSEFMKPSQKIFLLSLMVLLLGTIAVVLWKRLPQKPPAIVKEVTKPEAKKPPKPVEIILRSTIAGSWYPADAGALSSQIDGFFQKAQAKPAGNVIALILPHAGYQFSGQTAAAALKTIDKKYKRIVVIGPSHRVPMEEVLSVPRATHYQTPLGLIPLDAEFIDKLLTYPLFQNVPMADEYEHSVQIELPLLQYRLKDFKLVPIVAGSCSLGTINKAAAILRSLVDDETLVVASSDFVHYGQNYGYVPFTENIPDGIKKLDNGAYEFIKDLDCEGFLRYCRKTGATICGYVPIATLLSMLPRSAQAHLVNQTCSGEITGDYSNSVSYLSIAFSGAWESSPPIKPQRGNPGLSAEDKKQLLVLARKSLVCFLKNRQMPEPSELNVTVSDEMRAPRAAFVTLKKDSQLRGCIGDIFPRQPLYRSVIVNAINAAVNDKRFYPVTESECNDVTVEISALTAPQPVASADQIRIGIDGVVLNKDNRSAVFLPQVAPEQGWDVNQMLTHLSLKANLPPDAWKEGASFLVFQADVFGEEK